MSQLFHKVRSQSKITAFNFEANSSRLGKVDILWLDGGWVAKTPKSEITSWYDAQLKDNESGYLKNRIVNQDIKMDELVDKAREKQPGRSVSQPADRD